MPNWCENTLTVTGDPKMLEQFKEHVKAGDNEEPLSFMKILPISCSEDEQADKACLIWGTKWDAVCNGTAPVISKNGKSIAYYFDTAWAPPIPVVYEMSRMFPELKFKLRYYEPGMVFSGTFVAKDGLVIKNIHREHNI